MIVKRFYYPMNIKQNLHTILNAIFSYLLEKYNVFSYFIFMWNSNKK